VTVVAGAGTAVVAGAGARRVVGGAVGAGAAVVVVVSGTVRPVAVADPAAPRFPTNTVDGVNPSVVVVAWGREEITRDVLGEGSRFTAARMMATKSAPTPSARKTFWRVARSLLSHHLRARTDTDGRPNAAFLPMDGTTR
jgi:hypothetical protein